MSRTLFLYVLKRYASFFGGLWAAVLAIFLVTDFVDRAKSYSGPNWARDALVLYGYKALVVLHQVAPGVLLLAAAVTVASLAKRGELTALKALAFGPGVILLPVMLVASVVSVALIGFDDWVVAHASFRADEISVMRFHKWGDWGANNAPKQWFRHRDRVFNLQAGDAEDGFGNVTVLTLTPEFTLADRLDARRMDSEGGTRWRLTGVVDRSFGPDGRVTQVVNRSEQSYDLGVTQALLSIRPGKPEQMRLHVLRHQIAARRQVGLPDALYRLAVANRFAYPLAGIPAALLAVIVAMRRTKPSNPITAFVQGLLIATALWGLMVVARSLVLSGRVSPPLAAWLPVLTLGMMAAMVAFGEPALRRRIGQRALRHAPASSTGRRI